MGYVAPKKYYSQRYVVTKQVDTWLEQGYSERQIFLLYNHPASNGVRCSRGYNEQQQVAWDSCKYVEKALLAFNK